MNSPGSTVGIDLDSGTRYTDGLFLPPAASSVHRCLVRKWLKKKINRQYEQLEGYTVPRTRSSITWDNTFSTVLLPMRAKAKEAAERMKSPAKIAWKRGPQKRKKKKVIYTSFNENYEVIWKWGIVDLELILLPLRFFPPTRHWWSSSLCVYRIHLLRHRAPGWPCESFLRS